MEIKRFVTNVLEENIYLLICDKKCCIIDPGGNNIQEVLKYMNDNELQLEAILITHGHFDHILSINDILKFKNVPIYIGKEDVEKLFNSNLSLSRIFNGQDYSVLKEAKIIELKDGDTVFNLKVLHTPGHTSGSVCYFDESDNCIFTGDTLFKMSYGRVDFPTGDALAMRDSLNRLLRLDGSITVYPGHGQDTTIQEEYSNYYGTYY